MPLRHPQTPHPLGLIVARGMPTTFTAIGEDVHSRALTVLVGGDAPISTIVKVRVPLDAHAIGGGSRDGPVLRPGARDDRAAIVECGADQGSSDEVRAAVRGDVLGQGEDGVRSSSECCESARGVEVAVLRLQCDPVPSGPVAVLCGSGVRRERTASGSRHGAQPEGVPVHRGRLLTLPDEVLFVEQEQKEGEIRDAATIEKLLMKHVKNEEYVSFVMDKLQVSADAGGNDKGSVFRTVTGSSLTGLSKSM